MMSFPNANNLFYLIFTLPAVVAFIMVERATLIALYWRNIDRIRDKDGNLLEEWSMFGTRAVTEFHRAIMASDPASIGTYVDKHLIIFYKLVTRAFNILKIIIVVQGVLNAISLVLQATYF